MPQCFEKVTESTLVNYPGAIGDKKDFSSSGSNQEVIGRSGPTVFSGLDITIPGAPKDFSFKIKRENIFNSQAEVIVNAANTQLSSGGGIDGEIHLQGGQVYVDNHKALSDAYKQNYPEGFATMIGSGALSRKKPPINNVIVVAGPQNGDLEFEKKLYNCYYNSLVLAHKQNKKSIAFPAISTGICGGDVNKSAEVSLRAVADFIQDKNYKNTTLKAVSIHCYEVNDANKNAARKDDDIILAYEKALLVSKP